MNSNEPTPLRVLVAAESFLPLMNGVTKSILRILDHLDGNGHQTAVVAAAPGPDDVEICSGRPIPVDRVPGIALPMYPELRVGLPARARIRRLIYHFQPDVVHLAAPVVLGHQVGRVAQQLGIPCVAVYQTDLSGFASHYGLGAAATPVWSWLRSVHNRADLSLAPTSSVAAGLRQLGFERVAVWGRGVEHARFHPRLRSEEVRGRWGLHPSELAVGYVGRLAAEKQVEQLRVVSRLPGARLIVIGDGPERARLHQLLPDAVFTGFLDGDDLGRAVASLDVLAHTGEHETFCQAIHEAMAAGVAVVAPRAGGPVDLIEHGRTGLLYQAGNPRSLLVSLRRLTSDPAQRHRLAAAGRAQVAGRTWEAVGDELIGHYHSLLPAKPMAA